MTLQIRPVRKGDAALLLQLVRELAEYEKLSDEVDATEAHFEAALFGPTPNVFGVIAEWDGAAAGYALWFLNFSSFRGRNGIYLEDLYVRPSLRGRGIGRALLRHLAGLCVENGWTRFEWTVLDWNTPSIEFYRAHGATIEAQWQICRVTGAALERLASDA